MLLFCTIRRWALCLSDGEREGKQKWSKWQWRKISRALLPFEFQFVLVYFWGKNALKFVTLNLARHFVISLSSSRLCLPACHEGEAPLTMPSQHSPQILLTTLVSASGNLTPTNHIRPRVTRDNPISTIEDCEQKQTKQDRKPSVFSHLCPKIKQKKFFSFLYFLGKLGKSLWIIVPMTIWIWDD